MPYNPIKNAITFIGKQWKPSYEREKRRWGSAQCHNDGIRVFYGFDDLSVAIRQIGGGLVKCGDLDRFFPNSPTKPNILYLVSSALPRVGPGFAGLFLPDSPIFMTRFTRKAGGS